MLSSTMSMTEALTGPGRWRSSLAALVFLFVVGRSTPAASQDTSADHQTAEAASKPVSAEAKPSGPASWYGYQTFAPDALALTIFVVAGGVRAEDPAVATVAGLYLLGAPTVHALHRRPGAVVGSLSLRIVLPFLSSVVGAAVADCGNAVVNDEACDFGERFVGFGVGMLLAMVADAALLSWERPAPPPGKPSPPTPRAARTSTTTVSLAPVPLRGGGGLVFTGLF
jgi:hypothetical protein